MSMEQEPTQEQVPKSPKELQLTEEEITLLDGFDEATEEGVAARDAWMQAHDLEYGDDVVVKNEGQPDRVFTTNPVNFFDRKTEDTLLRESYDAASRMVESIDVENLEIPKSSEVLRSEASEDLGEEAVEQFVIEPEENEEIAEVSLPSEELATRIKAAEHQFLLREGYTRSEMYSTGARELLRLEEESGNLNSVVNSLRIATDLKTTLQARVNNYEESKHQLDGRSMEEFNPYRVLARQVEEAQNDVLTIQRSLRMYSEQSIGEISSSQNRFTSKVAESISEVESNRNDFESVISEIETHSSEVEAESSLQNKDELHNKLTALMEPLGDIADNRLSIDARITNELENVNIALRGLSDIYEASIRGNNYDPALLGQVYSALESLGSADTSQALISEQEKMNSSIAALKASLQSVNS